MSYKKFDRKYSKAINFESYFLTLAFIYDLIILNTYIQHPEDIFCRLF